MKIACIGTGWYPRTQGGLEKYVYGMTRALVRAGDDVDLFVADIAPEHEQGANIFSLAQPGDSLFKRARAARHTFATSLHEPLDVINIHFAMNALPLIPFIKHSTPRVVHFHGPWAAESSAEGGGKLSVTIKAMLERFIYRRADRFIVLSTAFKHLLVGYGVKPAQISVIPMGIDCDFFQLATDRAAVRAQLGWPADTTVFFTARRLVNRVGLHELLQATRLARDTNPNFVLKIAGKGPLRAELAEKVISLGLGPCVELLGFVSEDDLVRCYQAADVTLVPSQALEGFGTIISESLACGTPVIVTPVGGMPEAVAPLSAELVTRSASAEDIAERMLAVIENTLKLPATETCRVYAVDRYDWNNVVQQIRAVFRPAPAPAL